MAVLAIYVGRGLHTPFINFYCHCELSLNLSLRGAVRRRSNLLVEEIASPLRGSQRHEGEENPSPFQGSQ
jgi:hypothetical protein